MREENFAAELYPRRVAGTTHSRYFWQKISRVAAPTNAPDVSPIIGRCTKINLGPQIVVERAFNRAVEIYGDSFPFVIRQEMNSLGPTEARQLSIYVAD